MHMLMWGRSHTCGAHACTQDVLRACKGLRSLHVCMEAPAAPSGDSSALLLQLAAALPQLRALQLRCPRAGGTRLRESHFSEEFVAQVGGADLPGLQLLQVCGLSYGTSSHTCWTSMHACRGMCSEWHAHPDCTRAGEAMFS